MVQNNLRTTLHTKMPCRNTIKFTASQHIPYMDNYKIVQELGENIVQINK